LVRQAAGERCIEIITSGRQRGESVTSTGTSCLQIQSVRQEQGERDNRSNEAVGCRNNPSIGLQQSKGKLNN